MINTYGVRKMTSMEYYRVFQEVQSAKELARTNVQTQLATHEREKHQESVQQTQSSSKPGVGSNLDISV